MCLQPVRTTDRNRTEKYIHHQFTEGRIGDGLFAAHVRIGGSNGSQTDDRHDPSADINEVGGVQNYHGNQNLDHALHSIDRQPTVGGGSRKSLACGPLGFAFCVAGIVFHVADDLHQKGKRQSGQCYTKIKSARVGGSNRQPHGHGSGGDAQCFGACTGHPRRKTSGSDAGIGRNRGHD